jgi:hypothetical protein
MGAVAATFMFIVSFMGMSAPEKVVTHARNYCAEAGGSLVILDLERAGVPGRTDYARGLFLCVGEK